MRKHGSSYSSKMFELSKSLLARVDVSVSQLNSALTEFKNVCYANSLGPESMVLTDLIWGAGQEIEIFTIDTGRLDRKSTV